MQPTAPALPGPYTRLRTERFAQRVKELGLGTDLEVAERIGVSEATVNRARNGQITPSARFIAACVSGLGVPFEYLFEIDGTS